MLAALSVALMAGACAQLGETPAQALAGTTGTSRQQHAEADPRSELDKAIVHWGREYARNPRDLKAAVSYARNLKAAGEKDKALEVLQQASLYHGSDRELASEYGRLALEFGQVSLAHKLLTFADDPGKPDWRVISALGTVQAKQGNYKAAIPYYERAQRLAPDQPSVTNNLALALAADGQPDKAEPLLRRAAEAPAADAKVRQNLALVLGLQGRYAEAREAARRDLPEDRAAADVDYLRRIVRLEPKPAPAAVAVASTPAPRPTVDPQSGTAVGGWVTRITEAAVTTTPHTTALKPSQR